MMARILFMLLLLAFFPGCNREAEPVQSNPGPQAPVTGASDSVVLGAYLDGELWGFRDGTGTVVIPARYQMAEDFREEGWAYVIDDEGWACIDRSGSLILRPFVYDNGPDSFSDDLARFVVDGLIGFYNRSGKIIIPARFAFALPFENGQARVCGDCVTVPDGEHQRVEGQDWWTIDKKGIRLEPQ